MDVVIRHSTFRDDDIILHATWNSGVPVVTIDFGDLEALASWRPSILNSRTKISEKTEASS